MSETHPGSGVCEFPHLGLTGLWLSLSTCIVLSSWLLFSSCCRREYRHDYGFTLRYSQPVSVSISVSTRACHARKRGSTPRQREIIFISTACCPTCAPLTGCCEHQLFFLVICPIQNSCDSSDETRRPSLLSLRYVGYWHPQEFAHSQANCDSGRDHSTNAS